MADGSFNPVLRHIRRLAGDDDSGHLSDRDLLRLFAERGEEAAFSVLVDRHGPLVLGVCKRVLRHQQDAEDAMQATFLVLARKAGSVPWHESVGNWLYGVAHRVSMKLRSSGARRREREQKAGELADASPAEAPSEAAWGELKGVLDEELSRLPRHYREPLLMCYLQDRTQEEAAKQLGWSLGAVRGRLFRGREMLRRRLAARGLALSAALFTVVLVQSGAKASVPGVLIQAATKSATAFAAGSLAASPIRHLAEGALQAMFWNKVKTVTASVLALAIVCTGTGMLLHQALAGRPADVVAQKPAAGESQRPALAPADDRPDPDEETHAVIKAVDAAKGLLTVVLDEERQEVTYDALNAKIQVCGKVGQLSELKKSMRCALKIAANNTTLTAINAGWPTFHCDLKDVDAGKGTLTVAVEANDQTFDLTLNLEKDGKVKIGDLWGGLADVPAGAEVRLQLTADKKGTFLVETDRPRGELPAILKSVNASKRLVVVTVELDDEKIDLAFDVAAEARVRVTGKDGTLDGLKEGMRVDLKLAEDRKTVIGVRADVAPPPEKDDD